MVVLIIRYGDCVVEATVVAVVVMAIAAFLTVVVMAAVV